MRRKSLALLLAIVAASAGAAWWYGGSLPFGREQVRDDHLTLYGNVDIRQVQLGFRVAGRLAETMPEEGDTVAAGTVLARLEAGPYQDAERAARASSTAACEIAPLGLSSCVLRQVCSALRNSAWRSTCAARAWAISSGRGPASSRCSVARRESTCARAARLASW